MRVGYGSVPEGVTPPVPNLLMAIAASPDVAALQWPLRRASAGDLGERLTELVISAVAAACASGYVWGHHAPRLESFGYTTADIEGLRDGDLSAFDPADRAVIMLAQSVEARAVTDETWVEVANRQGRDTARQVTLLAGYYSMMCRIQVAFDVPLDEGAQGLDYPASVESPSDRPRIL
jgi:hypothetical protein